MTKPFRPTYYIFERPCYKCGTIIKRGEATWSKGWWSTDQAEYCTKCFNEYGPNLPRLKTLEMKEPTKFIYL